MIRRIVMYGFIYITTNKINGMKYIGMCKSSKPKEADYLGSGTHFKKAVKKYGKENFVREIVEECQTFEQMCLAERSWISKFSANSSDDFYNITAGGFGGCSQSMKSFWKQFTKEERKQLRKWNKKDNSGTNNPMYGKVHSEETKKKIGSKSKNRNWGRKTPVSGGCNPTAIAVKLLRDNGQEEYFDCIKAISIKYGYNYSTLKTCYRKQNWSTKYKVKIVDA